MYSNRKTPTLQKFTTNELSSELFKRGNISLLPATEEDEIKIRLFKASWQKLSAAQISIALTNNGKPVVDTPDNIPNQSPITGHLQPKLQELVFRGKSKPPRGIAFLPSDIKRIRNNEHIPIGSSKWDMDIAFSRT